MPSRTKVDDAHVIALLEEGKTGREVARLLGIHEQTVYVVKNRNRGACRKCGRDVVPGRKHCDVCLKWEADRVKARRAEQRGKGLCVECNEPVEWPSRTRCAKHRAMDAAASVKYEARLKRGTPNDGIPNERQRIRALRMKYGAAGVAVWERDNGRCVICGAGNRERSIQLHHVNQRKEESTEENLVCLCFNCHQLVHRLLAHSDVSRVLAWVRSTYPDVLLR